MNKKTKNKKIVGTDLMDPIALMGLSVEFRHENFDSNKISETQIDVAEVRLRRKLAEEMVRAFDEAGLTYKDIAKRLEKDQALICRRFKGEENLTLKTIAAMFLAMGRDVHIHSTPLTKDARPHKWIESRYAVEPRDEWLNAITRLIQAQIPAPPKQQDAFLCLTAFKPTAMFQNITSSHRNKSLDVEYAVIEGSEA